MTNRFAVDYVAYLNGSVHSSGVHFFETEEKAFEFVDYLYEYLPEEIDVDYEIVDYGTGPDVDDVQVTDLSKLDMY